MPAPCNIYLISGNDSGLIFEHAAKLIKSLGCNPDDAFACDIFAEGDNGPTPELITGLIASLNTTPMIGYPVKFVWLKHYTGFDKESDKKSTNPDAVALRTLGEVLKNGLPPDIVLVMDGPGIDQRRAIFKACAANGKTILLNKPDISQKNWEEVMRGCIRNAAQDKGVRLEPLAEDYLLDALGSDTARIGPELEKVICFRGSTDGVITLQELQEVCVGKGEEMTWALANVLGQRNLSETLRVIDVLISQNKNDDGYANAMLISAASFFRHAIRIKVFMVENKLKTPVALKNFIQGMSAEQKDTALKAGMEFVSFHPFRVQNMAAQAERYAPHEIIRAITLFRDAIWQIRSSNTSPRMALESALFQIIGVTPQRFRG